MSDSNTVNGAVEADNPYENKRYRGYVLFILTVVYAFNFIDRQLISILQESIKNDLSLSDTQLGLLTGFAFAVFYVTAGIPIARWSDRANRRNIIAMAVGVWSAMTAISGACTNYVQMLIARIGVGVGEAGGTPPAHSMISDIYPEEKRGTALSIYSVGINLGIMFGFFFGGIINEYFGWRMAFVIVGLPGILIAILIRMTVAEPMRGMSEKIKTKDDHVPFSGVLKEMVYNPIIRNVMVGSAIFGIAGYGAFNWLAPFYIRSHSVGTAELGLWLSLSIGLFGGIGTFTAGLLADKLGKISKGWYMWIPAFSAVLIGPMYYIIFTTTSTSLALWLNFVPSFLLATYIGTGVAVLHSNVSPSMRATISAMFYFMINIIGLGLGPTMIGMLSDYLAPELGAESLRTAMIYIIPTASLWAAIHYFQAGRLLHKKDRGQA